MIYLIILRKKMMSDFCAKHGNYCGERCTQCIKIKEIHMNIVREYKKSLQKKRDLNFHNFGILTNNIF